MNFADGIGILAVLVLALVVGCEKKPTTKTTAIVADWIDSTLVEVDPAPAQPEQITSTEPATTPGESIGKPRSPEAEVADSPGLPQETLETAMVIQAAEVPTKDLGQVRGEIRNLARSAIGLRKLLLDAQLTSKKVPADQGERP